MNVKPIIRILQGMLAITFALLSFDGAFALSAKAGGSSSIESIPTSSISSKHSFSFSDDTTAHKANPSIINENNRSIQIELLTNEFAVEEFQADGKTCQVLKVADYAEFQKPGWPRLPVFGTMVGIPENSHPTLTIIEADASIVDGRFDLCPAGSPDVEFETDGQVQFQGETQTWNSEVYGKDEFLPGSPAELSEPASIRSQSVVQLQFNPFQYNPVTGQLRLYKRLLVQVDFGFEATSDTAVLKSLNEGAFETVLQDNLVNYDAAAQFRTETAAALSAEYVQAASSPEGFSVKILVNQEGMVAISYEDLVASGLDLTGINPASFQVSNQGAEIAIDVLGDEDGSLDAGDKIVFFGQPLNTRYTDTNVYWLSWGSSNGRRMNSLSAPAGTGKTSTRYLANQHLETNAIYQSTVVDTRGDHWFWTYLAATSAPASSSYNFTPANLDTSATSDARLRGSLKSNYATSVHHAKIYLNNNFITEGTWNVGTQYDFDLPVPMNYLVEGINTIRVDVPYDTSGSMDTMYVNWFEVDYWRTLTAVQDVLVFDGELSGVYNYQIGGFTSPNISLFDITDPASVIGISDVSVQPSGSLYQLSFKVSSTSQHRYLAVTQTGYSLPKQVVKDNGSNLKSTTNGADYLLITPTEFASEMQRLADFRASQGMRVQMVDVQDIYDEFNYGIMDPVAIRDFIAFTYQNWQQPAPQFVLLAGDGHYDPRNYKGTNEKIFIPAYLLPVDPFLLETASDNRFVTVSGTDNLPDLAIGRLPIKTAAEASAVVTKLIDYEQVPFNVDWTNNVLFVSDNPDSAGSFYTLSDKVVDNYLPLGYTPVKVYLGSTHSSASSAQTAILDQINQGSLLVNYVGHGTSVALASENLLRTNSVSSFTNSGRLSMFAMMACLTGSFHYPSPVGVDNSSIAETFFKAANKGAIASLGSSGMGLSTGQDYLNRGLYKAIFYDGETQVGAAAYQAKLFLYSQTTSFRDLLDTFTLFGDPATKLNVRPSDLTVQLEASNVSGVSIGMPITYTLTYRNIGLAQASHVRIDHPLPDTLLNPVIQTSDADAVQITGSRIAWEIEALAPGEAGTILLTGIVDVATPSTITSQATIDSPIADSDTTNNITPMLQIPIYSPTAVTIESGSAVYMNNVVDITWTTANELGLQGFNLYRSINPNEQGILLNETEIPSQNSGSLNGFTYHFEDMDFENGTTYFYHLEIIEGESNAGYDFQPVTINNFMYYYLPFLVR